MNHSDSALDGLRIASPCAEDWNSMTGDARVRVYRRADGTVITRDCPVGLRRKNEPAPDLGRLHALMGETAVPPHRVTAGIPVFRQAPRQPVQE